MSSIDAHTHTPHTLGRVLRRTLDKDVKPPKPTTCDVQGTGDTFGSDGPEVKLKQPGI